MITGGEIVTMVTVIAVTIYYVYLQKIYNAEIL